MLQTLRAVLLTAQPAKPLPPEVKFVGAEVRGSSAYMAFEVANPNADPVPYLGYRPDYS